MKKSLLLGAALLAAATASAVGTDGVTYETVEGITATNLWVYAPDMNKASWDAICEEAGLSSAYARSMAVNDGKMYIPVGGSYDTGEVNEKGDPITGYNWKLLVLDLYTGEILKQVPITKDGEQYNVLLGCNNIGFDDYGHCWIMGYFTGSEKNPKIPVHLLDVETGALTLSSTIVWPYDQYADMMRMDYMDLTGDVTAQEADAYFIGNGSGATFNVYRFVLPQGAEEWEGGMDGYACWVTEDIQTWPADAAGWGDNPGAYFAKGSNDIIYANARSTYQSQYSCADGMPELLGSFEMCPDCQPNKPGAVGAWEFTLGNKTYLGYGDQQGAEGGKFRIAQMGGDATGGTYEGMIPMWTFPGDEKTFTSTSNSGCQLPVKAWNIKDANGKEGALVGFFYKASEVGCYLIAEEGFDMGGVSDIAADNNAAVEYFNLQGVRVANPENGLYIKRQGNNATKVLVK